MATVGTAIATGLLALASATQTSADVAVDSGAITVNDGRCADAPGLPATSRRGFRSSWRAALTRGH